MSHTLPVADARQSRRHLAGLLRPRWRLLALITFLLLAGSAAALLMPPALGRIVDAVLAGAGPGRIAAWSGAVAAAGLVSALLLRQGGLLLVRCLQQVLAALREEIFDAAVRLDQGTVEDAGTSDVVSRVTGDVEAITAAVSGVLPRFVQGAFTITLTFAGLAALDPWLALAALVAVPVQVWTTVRFLRRSRPLYRRLRRQESDRGQAIIETVSGAATVIAHSRRRERLDLIATRSLAAVETAREATRARNRFNAGLNTAEFLGLAAVLSAGYWQATTAGLSVGSVTAAALFFHRLFSPIAALLSSLDDLQRAAAGLGRLVGVLLAGADRAPRRDVDGRSVRIHALTHHYRPGTPAALSGIDLDIPAGTVTVLAGVSGSGKSTLAQLVAGVFAPAGGEVLIGGVPATEAGHRGRRAVLLVTQDTHLFTGTLAGNLRLAAPDATDDALLAALDTVGAEWTRDLPDGLDTVLGHDLDDARIQQIALARVLLADPPVVVLDEATAHGGAGGGLDDAVRAVIRGRTAIIVAHRFTQAATADLVVVLDRGRIREQGSHADLAAHGGAYARLLAVIESHR
ncbi:ABC transporter ATP-binding protein [Actinoplanes couchii]|uniref:Multidrug ABC transporter permease n=1 Tax=Actinoplanes couchii TaxID=403638 RepID=A0ABQ3XGK5_9ACTN|nr:ABC transporter ATP-binding protein [Actinoplanes couchii]MDR6321122.1 ABC-type multidrug transport system fused ATPase/permease subunit [Actinoplanes couchii]GID57635.1 multidrug ABC transporter permease [Actinoplanes couchii]